MNVKFDVDFTRVYQLWDIFIEWQEQLMTRLRM